MVANITSVFTPAPKQYPAVFIGVAFAAAILALCGPVVLNCCQSSHVCESAHGCLAHRQVAAVPEVRS